MWLSHRFKYSYYRHSSSLIKLNVTKMRPARFRADLVAKKCQRKLDTRVSLSVQNAAHFESWNTSLCANTFFWLNLSSLLDFGFLLEGKKVRSVFFVTLVISVGPFRTSLARQQNRQQSASVFFVLRGVEAELQQLSREPNSQ